MKILGALGFTLISLTCCFGQTNFELIQSKDQIYIYTNPEKNRKTIEYWAHTTIEGKDIKEVLSIFTQYNSHSDWVYNCQSSQLLKHTSDTVLLYQICDASWPFKNRDYILSLKKVVVNNRETKISFSAIDNQLPTKKGLVRLDYFKGYWLLQQTDTGVKVSIKCEFDPKLKMPRAFRKSFEKKIPYHTLKQLKAQIVNS